MTPATALPCQLFNLTGGAGAVRVGTAPRRAPAPARARPLAARRRTASLRCCSARNSDVHRPAENAVRSAVGGMFRPLIDNFNHLSSLDTFFDTEDYHVGMPFGALIACIGCYRLWKLDAWTFVDAVLGYALYRLSVLSSQVRKQGFSSELITWIKSFVVFVMFTMASKRSLAPLDYYIRLPVFALYLSTYVCFFIDARL